MTALSTEALVERLDAARARVPGPALLAVDGDGTLWDPDVAQHYVRWHYARHATRAAGLASLRVLAAAHGLRDAEAGAAVDGPASSDAAAHAILGAIIRAYLEGTLTGEAAFASGAFMSAGHAVSERLADAEAALTALGPTFQPFAGWAPVLAWAAAADVEVWVVSAGPWPMAVRAAARHGIPAERVIAARTRVEAGHYTDTLDGPVPYGADKVRALAAFAGDRACLAAFGDALPDLPLLRAAHLGIAVRPNAALRGAAPDLPHWDPGVRP